MSEKTNLTKALAVEKLAETFDTTKVTAAEIYDAVTNMIAETLENGGDVRLPGVGTIHRVTLAARTYVVPGTDKTIDKPERTKYKISCKAKA